MRMLSATQGNIDVTYRLQQLFVIKSNHQIIVRFRFNLRLHAN